MAVYNIKNPYKTVSTPSIGNNVASNVNNAFPSSYQPSPQIPSTPSQTSVQSQPSFGSQPIRFDYTKARDAGLTDEMILQHLLDQKKKGIVITLDPNEVASYHTKASQPVSSVQPSNTVMDSTKDNPNYNIFKPADANAGIGEKIVRGIGNFASNVAGKFGNVLEGVTRGVENYGASAVSAFSPTNIKMTGKQVTNPLTGDKVQPWFSANKDGTPQSFTQGVGEILQHGAELAPWLMGGGEASAVAKSTGITSKIGGLFKSALPLATGFGASGALGEAGSQMQTGEYNPAKVISEGATQFGIGLAGDVAFRGITSKFKNIAPALSDNEATVLAKKAIEDTKKIFNPTSSELKNIEFKQKKNIDDGITSILENVSPESIAKDASNKRLDTSSAVEDMKNAVANSSNANRAILEKYPEPINLENARLLALKDAQRAGTGLEQQAMEENINKIIDAEIARNGGSPILMSPQADLTKSGLWSISKFDKGYVNLPSMVDSARSVGFALKDLLESTYSGVVKDFIAKSEGIPFDIKLGNKKTADALMGMKLIENAHNRLVKKGVNPMARLAIMLGSHQIPLVGPIIAEKATSAIDAALHNPEKLFKKASDTFKKSKSIMVKDIPKEITPALKAQGETLPTKITIKAPKESNQVIDKLSAEAKKYKSAEKFVKAQGDVILHGTNKKFSNFDVSKLGTNEKDFPAQNAFFFTDSLDTAKSYGKNIVERYGNFEKPITIDAEGKMYGDFREELRTAVENAKKNGNDVVIIKNLSDRKDWGNYEATTHYAVLDTTKLRNKSQLTDIWNKANGRKINIRVKK